MPTPIGGFRKEPPYKGFSWKLTCTIEGVAYKGRTMDEPRSITFQVTEWSAGMILHLLKGDPTFYVDWGAWMTPAHIHGGTAEEIKELFDILEPDFKKNNSWIRLEHRR